MINIYTRGHLFDLDVQGPLAKAQVEAFLDDHPDFIESYVLRKVERWVVKVRSNLIITNPLRQEPDRQVVGKQQSNYPPH